MPLAAIPTWFKDLFEPQLKHLRHLEGQRQARIVLAGFNRIDRLATYPEPGREFSLRPFALGSKDA
jgi:hypothetical protein